jgi:hypothetical protein
MLKRVLLGFAAVGVAFVFFPMPTAGAAPQEVSGNGNCQGTAAFQSGHQYTAADSGVDEIPLKDTVNWTGSIEAPSSAPDWAYAGHIQLELPPPLPAITIDDWSGTTDATGNSGVKKYDLPSFVPRGVELEVTGSHTQADKSCSGTVTVKVEGGAFDSPAAPAALVGTAATGVGAALAGRAKKGL